MTALELEFVIHYKELDAASGKWNGLRIRRLCNIMNLTQSELARLLRVTPGLLAQWITSGKFPACFRLMLELVERSAHRSYLGKAYSKTLFPSGTI